MKRRRRRNSRARQTVIGVAVLVLGLAGFYFSITHQLPFFGQGGQLVTAYFGEPNQLQAGNTPVRVGGIDVGTVDSINRADGGRSSRVVLRITDTGVQLHADASAAVEFRTLLGANFVVDLNPGSPSAPPLGNAAIPLRRTTVQTEFDDVLGVFRGNTPAATRTDLSQLSGALSGGQLRSLINTLPPSLTDTAAGFSALQGRVPGDLSGLIASAARTTHTLAADRSALESVIKQGQSALGAVAGQQGALGHALDAAPAALDQTVGVSHSIEQTVPPLQRLLVALGPGAKALGPAAAAARPAAQQLRAVLDEARPLLAKLRPAVNQLAAASGPGRSLLNGLAPTLTRLSSQLIPWLESDDSDLHMPVYQLIGPFFSSLGSAAAGYDGTSHVLNFPIQPEADSLTLVPCTVFVNAPTPSELLKCASLNQVLSLLLTGSTNGAKK